MKIKFEVIRDLDGDVNGYKLGEWYLIKRYYWGNNYEWIINQTGETHYFDCEFSRAYSEGKIEIVSSCKRGKEILIKRFLEV